MRARGAWATVVAVVALGGLVPSAEAAAKGCVAGERLTGNAHGFLATFHGDLYGCPRALQGGKLVDRASVPYIRWRSAVLAGSMVAVERSSSWKSAFVEVAVYDLARWRQCSRESAGTAYWASPADNSFIDGARTSGLTVTRTGAVAFVAGPGSLEPGLREQPAPWSGYEVVVRDAAGQRQLDAGPDIDPASLRRIGRTLTWTHGGEQRTATLGRGPRPCTGLIEP